jgi:hypothetical protein
MPHIHTGPGQHDFTASAFIIRLDTPEPTMMLHMHRKLHKYLQFGGHVELHENPWQAITHELAEESGYDIHQLKLLQPRLRLKAFSDAELHPYPINTETHKFPEIDHYHTDIAYLFTTGETPNGAVREGESLDIQNFTLQELRDIPADKIAENVRLTAIFALEECLGEWEAVSW